MSLKSVSVCFPSAVKKKPADFHLLGSESGGEGERGFKIFVAESSVSEEDRGSSATRYTYEYID